VLQANIVQKLQSRLNLQQYALSDLRLHRTQAQIGKKLVALLDGHGADIGDALAVDKNVARLLPQTRALGFRTYRISPISAQKYPHVQLVFFCFQIIEELTDRVHYKGPFISRQVAKRHVHANAAALRRFLKIVKVSTIAWLRPGLDGAIIQS